MQRFKSKRFILTFLIGVIGMMYATYGFTLPQFVLVFTPNGQYVMKTTLQNAATSADCSGKTIVVTTPLSGTYANISSASGANWPTDRALRVEKGGSIGNTTTLRTQTIQAGKYQIFNGTGSVRMGGEIPCEWFGAVPSSDNTVAVQTAINSAYPGSKIVIPASLFHTGILINANNLTITSNGALLGYTDQSLYSFTAPEAGHTDGDDVCMFVVQAPSSHITFDNINVNCFLNRTVAPGGASDYALTVQFMNGTTYGAVRNSTFTNQVYGFLHGVSLHFRSGSNFMQSVNNTFISDTVTTGVGGGAEDMAGTNQATTGCTFINTIDAALSADDASNILIDGNTFSNTRVVGGYLVSEGCFIQLGLGTFNAKVTGNSFYGVSQRAIFIYNQYNAPLISHDIVIAHNVINGGGDVYPVNPSGNSASGAIDMFYSVNGGGGNTAVPSAYNITIEDNDIFNLSGGYSGLVGMQITTSGIKVLNNTIDMTANANSNLACIRVFPSTLSSNNTLTEIKNNTLNGSTSGLRIEPGDYKYIFSGYSTNIELRMSEQNYKNQNNGINDLSTWGLDTVSENGRFTNILTSPLNMRGVVTFSAYGVLDQPFRLGKLSPTSFFSTTTATPNSLDTWLTGDRIYFMTPSAGGYIGYVCTKGGTGSGGGAAVWKLFGAISS